MTPAGQPGARTGVPGREFLDLYRAARNAMRAAVTEQGHRNWARILITGSRDWADHPGHVIDALETILLGLVAGTTNMNRVTFVHGGARGLDTLASHVALREGWQLEVHPVMPEQYRLLGRRAPLARDRAMVGLGATACVGFPKAGGGGGTWFTLGEAWKARIPTFVAMNAAGPWELSRYHRRQAAQVEELPDDMWLCPSEEN